MKKIILLLLVSQIGRAQLFISGSPPLPVTLGGTGTTTATGSAGDVVLSNSPSINSPFINNIYGGSLPGSLMTIEASNNNMPVDSYLYLQPDGQYTIYGNLCSPPSLFTISTNASCNPTGNSALTGVQIIGADNSNPSLTIDAYGSGGNPILLERHADGTGASPSPTTSLTDLFLNIGQGWDSTNLFSNGGNISIQASQNWTTTAHGTQFSMSLVPINSTTLTGALLLSNSIFTLVTATTVNWPNVTTINIPGLTNVASAATGYICWETGTGAVTYDTSTCTTSSKRYKHDIHYLKSDFSLKLIDSLRPVRFIYNRTNEKRSGGLIAEDVVKVDPNLVEYDKDNLPRAVKYNDLIPILISAMQEQQKEIEALKKELKDVQNIHYNASR